MQISQQSFVLQKFYFRILFHDFFRLIFSKNFHNFFRIFSSIFLQLFPQYLSKIFHNCFAIFVEFVLNTNSKNLSYFNLRRPKIMKYFWNLIWILTYTWCSKSSPLRPSIGHLLPCLESQDCWTHLQKPYCNVYFTNILSKLRFILSF